MRRLPAILRNMTASDLVISEKIPAVKCGLQAIGGDENHSLSE